MSPNIQISFGQLTPIGAKEVFNMSTTPPAKKR